jgi:hypothetical protein
MYGDTALPPVRTGAQRRHAALIWPNSGSQRGGANSGDQFALLVDDPQGGVAEFDSDGLARTGEADLDALSGDLDAAAAGDLPLPLMDKRFRRRPRC